MRKSKLIPFLLATIMIISLIQITAFAANGEPDMIQLENKTGRSYSIKDGTIKLFCPYEGYEGTETVHSGTTWFSGSYREIKWTIKDGVGTLLVDGSYYLVNALDFEGGNGLTDVIVFVKDSSTLSLCPGLSGIGWYYPTPYVVLANNVNITFSGTSLGEEYVKAHISMRNECGFSDKAPETIYTVVVNGGDLTVDGDIYFSSVSVVQNRVTSSATNIYVPDGSVVVNNAVRFWAQSDAHNAVGYNIYAGKSIILDANSYITSYCEYNPSSVNMSASEIKIGKGEITINIDESKSTPFTVEPSLVYNKDNYKIDVVFDDTGTKYIYNYIGSITPEDNGQGEDSGREAFPFTDVLPDDWFYEAVKYLYEHGVTNGTSDTTFSPGMDLTRGQFITLIMRAYGIEPDENPGDNFSDAGNTYYTGYLAAAKRLGISKGVGGNMFAPEKPLTRQEMCVLLYNLLNMLDKLPEQGGVSDASSFPDSNEVYDWASEAVSRFVSAGVITGSGGKLLPGGTTTRAQMAQVLYRLLSK